MYLVGLQIYCKMIHGPYSIKQTYCVHFVGRLQRLLGSCTIIATVSFGKRASIILRCLFCSKVNCSGYNNNILVVKMPALRDISWYCCKNVFDICLLNFLYLNGVVTSVNMNTLPTKFRFNSR